MNQENGPIFIGGLDRSGKTLLRRMLGQHPDLVLTRRTYFWTRYYKRYGSLGEKENLERCLAEMMRSEAVRALQPDPGRIQREFLQGPPTYARLFAIIHQQNARRLGKRRWGDQLGMVERYADAIFAAYPAARMIQMIRDPRDRYAAALPEMRGRPWKAGWSAARWLQSAGAARKNIELFGDRYKVVCYETLRARPEETLREVCHFLGERFYPVMLELPGMDDPEEGESDAQEGAIMIPETGTRAHGNGKVSAGAAVFTQMVTRRELAAFGYALEPLRLSAGEAVRFGLVDLPVNWAGMLAWQWTEGRKNAK